MTTDPTPTPNFFQSVLGWLHNVYPDGIRAPTITRYWHC